MKYGILSICFYFLLCSICLAQKKAGSISNDLKHFHDTHYEETVFVSTNSSFLLSGETLLFKVYCLNAADNTPSMLSTIAYVELIDANATSVLQAKILLNNGSGSGDLFLSSTLTSGNYTLIAYTNWMRNYSVQKFFKSELTIVNPFRKSTAVNTKKQGLQIAFFPEGGKLLNGITNTVVFSAVNEKMKGSNFTGKILDNSGSTVLEFSPSLAGKGRFTLTPEPGKEYKAVIIDSLQNVYFQPLPPAIDEGIAIHVEENESSFIIKLTSRSIGKLGKAKILIHRKSVPFFEKELQFNNEQGQLEVKKALLPPGISQITVFSEGNQVVDERIVFNKPINESAIELKSDKRNFKVRDRVRMTVSMKDTLLTNLAINVRKLESKVKKSYSISDYLLLQNGKVEMKSLTSALSLDDQIQLQKDSYYPVKNLEEEPTSIYLPEVRGNLITGTITKGNFSPAIKEKIYLSVPSTNYLFFVGVTDSTGRFFFNTEKITYNTEIILQTDPASCGDCTIKLDVSGLKDYSAFVPDPLEIDSTFKKIIERRSILAQIENAYYTEKQDSIIDKESSLRFYGKPDKTYVLDDFVRFPTMEDVFVEYVVEVILKKKGDQFDIRAMNFKERFAFNSKPLILIDGIPIFDENQVMNYNPLLLEKIEVLGRRYFYGPLEAQGIISMTTYTHDGKNISVRQKEKYIGILPRKRYFSPDYSKGSTAMDKIPDYRTQLYWNPNVSITSKPLPFEFYTSDVKGDFEIIIEGVKANGQPVHYSDVIHVE